MMFVVDQRQFGGVAHWDRSKASTEPSLNFKLPPPFQNVRYIDKRLLTLDSPDTESMLTAEKQRVVIDWYVRWRISIRSNTSANVGLDECGRHAASTAWCAILSRKRVNRRTVRGAAIESSVMP